ncbi:MAG: hypothetical protein ACOZNI_34395 [Myxococcota bacterium]
MKRLRAALDRELMVSAVAHDLRGSLTAAQGWVELEDPDGPLAGVLDRMALLVEALGDPVGEPEVARIEGEPVRVVAPIDILKLAIDGLQHAARHTRVEGEEVVIELHGVPAAEIVGGWTLAQVRAWLRSGGPGLAGARLQVAARRVGASRCTWVHVADAPLVTVTIRMKRG